MAGQVAPIDVGQSDARGCRTCHRARLARLFAPAAPDRLAPMQRARRPGARQRPLQGSKFDDADAVSPTASRCSEVSTEGEAFQTCEPTLSCNPPKGAALRPTSNLGSEAEE